MNGSVGPGPGKKVRLLMAFGIVAASVALASCDPGTAPGTQRAYVQVQITDAPSDMLASAEIWVSRVYLQGGADSTAADSAGSVDLFNDPANPKHYDLLTLQDSVTAVLTDVVDVDPGAYQQLRLVVDSARLTLADGYFFSDSTTSDVLFVPSGAESGIKVSLNSTLRLPADSTMTLVVDFPVDQNFVIQQNSDQTVRTILFTPSLKEQKRSQS